MIVNHTGSLQIRITDDRPHELETPFLHIPADLDR